MGLLTWGGRGRLWLRMGLRLLLCALLLWTLLTWGPTALSLTAPFLLAGGMAAALSPALRWLRRRLPLPRPALALLMLLIALAAFGGVLWWLGATAVREVLALAGSWEGLMGTLQEGLDRLSALSARFAALLPSAVRQGTDVLPARLLSWLQTAVPTLLSAAADLLARGAKALPSFAVSAAAFCLASFFLLSDWPRLRTVLSARLPKGAAPVKRAFSTAFGGYLKAQLLLSAGVFLLLLAGFLFTGEDYALLLALGLALVDFIPLLGAGAVLIPWALLDLLLGRPRHALGLFIVCALVILFRQLAEPKILSGQTGLPPLASLISVYAGMKLLGLWGMILAPVLCQALRSLLASGLLEPALSDARLALADLSAILKGPGENSKNL